MEKQNDFYIENGELISYIGDETDIVIPEGISRIGKGAFIENENLRSIVLPESLCWIGQFCFAKCKKLKSITIPKNVTFIDKGAFSDSGLEEIIIKGKPEIRLWAFDGTPWQVNELKIKDCVVRDNVLLSVNSELTEFTIPSDVEIIGRDAFKNSKIRTINIPNGVTKLDICAFAYSELEHISLPETLQVIGAYAFSNCENLTELVIPESVTDIDTCAFQELSNCVLTILNEQDDENQFKISKDAFAFGQNQPHIKEVCVPYGSVAMRYAIKAGLKVTTFPCTPQKLGNAQKYCYMDNMFCCEGDILHEYFGQADTVYIPEGIKAIDSHAFFLSKVKKVYLPKSVKKIMDYAFTYCEELVEIKGEGIREIGWHAFSDCVKLQKIDFPKLEKCYDVSFENCVSLKRENMIIPSSANVIEVKFDIYGGWLYTNKKYTPFTNR